MNRLDDPALRSRLVTACRRTGLVRRHRWWQWRRSSDPEAKPSGGMHGLQRAWFSGLVAMAGSLAARQPLAIQLLPLAGLLLMQVRIQQIRTALFGSSELAVLAQLPVPARTIFALQMRPVWRAAIWAVCDAAGFWAVFWSCAGISGLWGWLPLIAVTHAAVTLGLAFLLMWVWRDLGCALLVIIGGMVWGTLHERDTPWLWACVEPLLRGIGWCTPWGWLQTAALLLTENPIAAGAAMLTLLGTAAIVGWSAYARLAQAWHIPAAWRELAGRPRQAWLADEDAADPDEPDAACTHDGDAIGEQPVVAWRKPDRALAAMHLARRAAYGRSLAAFGWPGRAVLQRLDADDRWLVDLLAPMGAGPVQLIWACVMAGVAVVGAIPGISPAWGLAALAGILVFRRMPRRAALAGLFAAIAFATPPLAPVLGVVLPGAVALLAYLPLAGGTWSGIPMGCTALGSLPRTWRRLHRMMALLLFLRLLAGLPVVALVMLAFGLAFHPAWAGGIAAVWLLVVILAPWLAAWHLIKRTPGALADLGLGRRWLTMLHTAGIFGQAMSACAMLAGFSSAWTASDTLPGLLGGGIGLVALVVITALQIALLRHAYRSKVDLIPPA